MFQPRITLLLILAVFSSICQQAPAISTRQYELETTYNYHYTAAVLLNEPPPLFSSNLTKVKGTDVGYQVAASVELTAVWQDPSNPSHLLLEVLASDLKLAIRSRKTQQSNGFADHSSPLDDMREAAAVYLDWNDGRISKIYSFNTESESLLNFKKGIASLFQLQSVRTDAVVEVDASGRCTASYENLKERTFLKKKKNCESQKPTSSFSRQQKILSVSTVSSHQSKYNLKDDSKVLDTLTSTEVYSLRVSLRSQAGASVISRQYIRLNSETKSKKRINAASLTKAIESLSVGNNLTLVENDLEVTEESNDCGTSCKQLKDIVDSVRKDMQTSNIASTSAASAFIAVLEAMRRSSKADVLGLLKDSKNKNILPQLLDVVAAAQTAESFESALEIINFKSESDVDVAERFLQAVSLSTRPAEYLLEGLLKLSKKVTFPKTKEAVLLSLAAVTKNFASHPGKANDPLVENIKKYFKKNLEACANESCCQLYMRVLKNLGSEDMLHIILAHIDSKDKKTSVAAVKALKVLPESVFDEHVIDKLQRIYLQIGRRYDSSARTLALDALLEHQPSSSFLLEVLNYVATSSNAESELKTYTLQRLIEASGNDLSTRSKLKQILSSKPSLNNYHVFAQNGLSTAFSREIYSTLRGNSTFSSSTEAASGMMKRSAFDVVMRNPEDSIQILNFGLFTGGLGSLLGSTSDEPDEEEATAGMEITLAGVQLRPIVFFTGQGELMGHVWSGTASERMSALQATILLQDHRQVLPLQSGFFAVLDVRGSVSFDFGGEMQISLWNRNSHSIVEDIAAWKLDGSLNLATPFVKSSVSFAVSAQAKINFVTDVSFGDGLLACLRMGQTEVHIDSTVQKRESIPGTKHWIHKSKKRQDLIPGRTYALNDKNSVLCNEMFGKN